MWHNHPDMNPTAPPYPPTLLLTRPAPQSDRFAEAFRDRFGPELPIVVSPLMQVQDVVPDRPIPQAETLIFSSETAVARARSLGLPSGLTAWCVGTRTADAARRAGFRAVTGPGDGAGLARAMVAASVAGPCLFLRGEDVAADLAGSLSSAGIATVAVIVYRQVPLPLTATARNLLDAEGTVLLPLFSPRSARLAAHGIGAARAALRVAALSPAVASAAADLPATRLAVAAEPTASAMLDALATLVADPP